MLVGCHVAGVGVGDATTAAVHALPGLIKI